MMCAFRDECTGIINKKARQFQELDIRITEKYYVSIYAIKY